MNHWLHELRKTATLAFPMVLSQVSQHLVQLVDTAMIGRVGVVPLAASAFSSSVFIVPLVFCFGITSAVTILASAAFGKGSQDQANHILRVGIVLVMAFGLAGAIALNLGRGMLGHFGQPEEVVVAAGPYFSLLAWSMIPVLLFACVKNYTEAMNRAWAPLVILLGMVLCNVFLNWLFIFGKWGFPAMGLEGAGWATLASRTLAALAICALLAYNRSYQFRWISRDWWRIRYLEIREFLGIGIPSAFQIIFEVSAFVFAAIMMGWLGEVSLAAHQIAVNIAGMTFMVTLGISFATSVRISQFYGQGDQVALRRTGIVGWALSATFMTACMILLILSRDVIPTWFVNDREVMALAAKLLIVAGLFQVFDGIQVTMIGALRGIRDIRWPTVLVMVAYYGVCLPVAWFLGFRSELGGIGIWIGLAIGLCLSALALSLRFQFRTRHCRQVLQSSDT
jgi:multidrug resistance protein, MATE family